MFMFEVLLEDVSAKIVFKIAPDEVCVIGFVLSVGVFDEEFGSLNAEVVGFSFFEFTGPSELGPGKCLRGDGREIRVVASPRWF